MNVDQYEFFRKAVLLICGNLDIETALHECINYFREFMPADRMYLQLYEPGLAAMRTIAEATVRAGRRVDLLTPMSEQAKDSIRQISERVLPPAYIMNEPDKNTVSREMLAFHRLKAASIMLINLSAAGKPFGSLVIASEEQQFNEEHKALVLLLREPFVIAMANTLKHRELIRLRDILADDNKFLTNELYRISGDTIIGANFGLKTVMEQVRRVADRDTQVLLLGETGVGKDIIANAIHYSSHRRNGPFISVNCGAIPGSLIDSELFGHEKGAFTGALQRKRGRFERAHNGTIFLDEIGELGLNVQVRLLRVLQNSEIERVGGTEKISLSIRVIAATNQDLEKLIQKKLFREDLWFRLNVFPIRIPPLRERKSDIPALVQHFIIMKAKKLRLEKIPELAPGAISMLMDYRWPGNVRELENIVERALLLSRDRPLDFRDLLFVSPSVRGGSVSKTPETGNLETVIKKHILHVLKKTRGKIHGPGGAAELLGINAVSYTHLTLPTN